MPSESCPRGLITDKRAPRGVPRSFDVASTLAGRLAASSREGSSTCRAIWGYGWPTAERPPTAVQVHRCAGGTDCSALHRTSATLGEGAVRRAGGSLARCEEFGAAPHCLARGWMRGGLRLAHALPLCFGCVRRLGGSYPAAQSDLSPQGGRRWTAGMLVECRLSAESITRLPPGATQWVRLVARGHPQGNAHGRAGSEAGS